MHDDYNELNLYFEDREENETCDLWVYFDHHNFIIVKGVNGNPIRYRGWWTIPFIQYNRYSSAHIEADKVLYFVTIDNKREEE